MRAHTYCYSISCDVLSIAFAEKVLRVRIIVSVYVFLEFHILFKKERKNEEKETPQNIAVTF